VTDHINMLRALGDAYFAQAKRATEDGADTVALMLHHHAAAHHSAAEILEQQERAKWASAKTGRDG
jgi:hypothetical protein